MSDKINMEISQLMQDVQDAALESDTDPTQADYIADVNRRIGEIESAIVALKHELTRHGLNDW